MTKYPIIKDGIKHWECSKCKAYLPESEFYKDKYTKWGVSSSCRLCESRETTAASFIGFLRQEKKTLTRLRKAAESDSARSRWTLYNGMLVEVEYILNVLRREYKSISTAEVGK